MNQSSSQLHFQRLTHSFFSEAYEIVRPQVSAQLNWDEKKLRDEFTQNEVYGALLGGQLVSFLILSRKKDGVLEIPLLVTGDRYQGRGFMEALLFWLIALFQKESELWLEVHEGNVRARNLYRKLGFQEVGKRPRYYTDGAAALLFTLRL